jgi:hypothetical protein
VNPPGWSWPALASSYVAAAVTSRASIADGAPGPRPARPTQRRWRTSASPTLRPDRRTLASPALQSHRAEGLALTKRLTITKALLAATAILAVWVATFRL